MQAMPIQLLALVDKATLLVNMLLLITGVVAAGMGAFLLYALCTGVKVGLTLKRQRQAWQELLATSRRADGQPYPACFEGVCQACGRGDRRIYVPPSGEELCPPCYEAFWRAETGFVDDAASPAARPARC